MVELVGHGTTRTGSRGNFRFENVEPGRYALRVTAAGFAPESRFLEVADYRYVEVSLGAAPILLDPVVAEVRRIRVEGRVRDAIAGHLIVGAEVVTNPGSVTETDSHGRFRLDAVPAGIGLGVTIREFGYLPLDTVIVPVEDARYLFELRVDSVVEAMVEVQVERLEDRAAPRFAALYRNLNRERLLRYAGNHTPMTVLEFEYSTQGLDRIACVVFDEQTVLSGSEAAFLLNHTLPEETQRIEFMFAGAMLRVYTRAFMTEMIARNLPLRMPLMLSGPPPLCR